MSDRTAWYTFTPRRMTNMFIRDENGRRSVFGNLEKFQADPHWRDLVLFHEYFRRFGSRCRSQSSDGIDRRSHKVDPANRRVRQEQLTVHTCTDRKNAPAARGSALHPSLGWGGVQADDYSC